MNAAAVCCFGAEFDSHRTERRAGFRARFARRSLSQVVNSQAVPPADERRAKVSASLKTIAQRPAKSRCAQNPGVQLETPAFFIVHFSVSDFAFPFPAWKQDSPSKDIPPDFSTSRAAEPPPVSAAAVRGIG